MKTEARFARAPAVLRCRWSVGKGGGPDLAGSCRSGSRRSGNGQYASGVTDVDRADPDPSPHAQGASPAFPAIAADAPPSLAVAWASPACPRCGYDQSGVVGAANPAWPLASQCAECGCRIAWSDYFRRDFTLPTRWLEHAPRAWFPVALLLTPWIACLALPLFARLRMEHPIRWKRLLVGSLALGLLAAVVLSVLVTVTGFRAIARTLGNAPPQALAVVVAKDPSSGSDMLVEQLMPVGPIPNRELLRTMKPIFTDPWAKRSLIVESEVLLPTPSWIHDARRAEARGEPFPPLRQSRQRVTVAWLQTSPRGCWSDAASAVGVRLPLVIVAILCSVAAFVALPIARRRAKVRGAHLVRSAFYLAIGTLPLLVVLLLVIDACRPQRRWQPGGLLTGDWSDAVIVVPLGAVLTWWWWVAAHRYLRMERPWAVALSVSTIAVLTACAVELA